MKLTKTDYIIIFFFLTVSLIIFLFFKICFVDTSDRILMIQTDGDLYATYNLELLKENIELNIDSPEGEFKILVSKDNVRVLNSGCEDNICKRNIIKNPGESIVCVPSKILIKIVSDSKFNVDSVAY